jgi:hypothetical protein
MTNECGEKEISQKKYDALANFGIWCLFLLP